MTATLSKGTAKHLSIVPSPSGQPFWKRWTYPESRQATVFFRQVKSLTARICYATKIGFKDMNKGGRVPSTFGCTHPERA